MSIGSCSCCGGVVASIFMVDQKSYVETSSSVALRPVFGLWPPHCWGFETFEFLREEAGTLNAIPLCPAWVAVPTARPSGEESSKSRKCKWNCKQRVDVFLDCILQTLTSLCDPMDRETTCSPEMDGETSFKDWEHKSGVVALSRCVARRRLVNRCDGNQSHAVA